MFLIRLWSEKRHHCLLVTRKQLILDVCRLIFLLQESCELVARYTELENQQIQLNLNLQLAQENLKKAQEEAKGMAGEVLHS